MWPPPVGNPFSPWEKVARPPDLIQDLIRGAGWVPAIVERDKASV